MHALAIAGLLLVALLSGAAHAWGQGMVPKKTVREKGTEVSVVPFAGGDTDYGAGAGLIGAIEHYAPGHAPYEWRFETAGAASFKGSEGESLLVSPFQDVYLQLGYIATPSMRVLLRASYTNQSMLTFSGVGNDSPVPVAENARTGDDGYFDWSWAHPTVSFGVRLKLAKPVFLLFSNSYSLNWFRLPEQSKLRDDVAGTGGVPAGLVRGIETHGLFLNEYAIQYDSRNGEVDPRDGQYHQLGQRFAPGGVTGVDHRYGQTNLTLRFYTTPFDPYLTLATRLVVDLLYGDVPFYELGRVERTFAFGGPNAVRGVQGQRYYGKVKTFGSVEARMRILPFSAWGKPMVLGLATFVDAGRLWADYHRHPELDGEGLGLKYGIGGGPRLLVGQVLMLRGDVAWSPDANPVSGYLLGGHAF